MKKNGIRVIPLILAAILLLGALSGCGKKTEEEKNNNNNPNSSTPTPEFVYLPEYVEPEADLGRIGQSYAVGDKIYFTSYMPVGKVQELYPEDENENPWYFSIDGGVVHAEKIYGGGAVIYEDAVYATDAAAMPMPAPISAPEPEGEGTEDAAQEPDEFEAERLAAIEKYIQYDEDGNLVVPEGYQFWEYDKTEQVLMRMNIDGTDVVRLEDYKLPSAGEDMQSDGSLNSMMGDREGRLWVSEQVYSYSVDKETGEYIDGGEQTLLRQLSDTGAEVRRVDLEKVKDVASQDGWFYVQSIALDKDDNVYVLCDTTIYVIDLDGNILFNVKSDNGINSMLTLSDGRVFAAAYENDGQKLKVIDTARKAWGDSYKAPSNMYNCIPGSGDYDLYYNDGASFYGYRIEKGESEELLNWINADINGDYVRSIVPLSDGRIVVMLYNWNSGSVGTEMAILSKQPYSALGNKTVLTLACLYDYEIRDAVINFNKKNDKVRIEVKNYSVYNNYESEDEADHNAGLTKLNTEIISGTVPDLLLLDSLPAQQYMAKGLLEDLYPYIDKDPELGRDKLMESVLKAVEFEGKLYQTVRNFYVQTIVCPKSVVGDISGWTLAEMRQFQSKMPPESALFKDTTKSDMLRMFLMYSGNEFIDWSTGKCNFNSQGFIDLLEYANTFPKEIDWEHYEGSEYVPELTRLQEGTLLGEQLYIDSIMQFLATKTTFGGEMAVVGFPCESREGNLLSVSGGAAMSTKCRDKDAAWEFLRTYFLPKGENDRYSYGFSINRADMDRTIEDAMRKEYVKDESGKPVLQPLTTWWMDNGTPEGYEMKVMPAEQADIDQFMAIIASAKPVSGYDQDVFSLISAEAEAYFSGQKSARDVANVVQSKMQTYVNEHM